jgi:hypothetical protein
VGAALRAGHPRKGGPRRLSHGLHACSGCSGVGRLQGTMVAVAPTPSSLACLQWRCWCTCCCADTCAAVLPPSTFRLPHLLGLSTCSSMYRRPPTCVWGQRVHAPRAVAGAAMLTPNPCRAQALGCRSSGARNGALSLCCCARPRRSLLSRQHACRSIAATLEATHLPTLCKPWAPACCACPACLSATCAVPRPMPTRSPIHATLHVASAGAWGHTLQTPIALDMNPNCKARVASATLTNPCAWVLPICLGAMLHAKLALGSASGTRARASGTLVPPSVWYRALQHCALHPGPCCCSMSTPVLQPSAH